jgi:N-succinyldiaminopimelate aminotransferase
MTIEFLHPTPSQAPADATGVRLAAYASDLVSVRRLAEIPGFSIDRVAAAAGDDLEVLRMENLDTDLPPPAAAVEATRAALGTDEANSWLPFTGRDDLKLTVAAYVERRGGPLYDGLREVVITSGEGDAMLDALFCLTDPGDEVILTDPTYAGMLNRVRLAAATPTLVPLLVEQGEWRLDLDALRGAVSQRSRVVFVNNASFPSGWVASDEEWAAIASLCLEHELWLLYWGGFEGVLFDDRQPRHPAGLPDMRDRTVTVGAPSFEQRMIGWRVGWIVAPGKLADDVSRVQIYNGLVASGHNQIGVRVALELADDGLTAANAEWQRRRDETLRQLEGLPVVRPAGGWSLLLDVAALDLDCADLSNRLLAEKIAATPMRGWGGQVADRHLRFVFSNEPCERLTLLGGRVRRALER